MATGVQSSSSVRLIVYRGEIAFCDTLRDLVTLLQFKKREKSHGEALLLVLLLHGCFSRYFDCTNGTKWVQSFSYYI